MKELSQATQEQTRRIGEIVSSVDDVKNAASNTEAVIGQSQKLEKELEGAANAMFAMVQRFKIDDR